MSRRMDRVNVLLRQEISRVLVAELRDPRLASLVSVTRVDTSPDLHHAKVFISVFGERSDKRSTLKALRSASGFIHRTMRQRVALKTVPFLQFQLDESIERAAEVTEIIREAVTDSPVTDPRGGEGT